MRIMMMSPMNDEPYEENSSGPSKYTGPEKSTNVPLFWDDIERF